MESNKPYSGITQHTTGTIFQPNVQENVNIPTNEEDMTIDICDEEQEGYTVFGRIKIPPAKQRSNPLHFPAFSDRYKGSNFLELSLQRDIARVLISSIGKEKFMK